MTFYKNLCIIIEGNNIVHFSCASYVKLLREDDLNANIVDNHHLTMICCLGCNSNNGQQDEMSLPGTEICHLCHALD